VSETYVEVVRRCLAAVEADDVEAAVQMLDADVVITPSSELVTGSTGPYHGHAGARRWFAEAALAASIFHFGELSIGAVKEDLAARGLEIRR